MGAAPIAKPTPSTKGVWVCFQSGKLHHDDLEKRAPTAACSHC